MSARKEEVNELENEEERRNSFDLFSGGGKGVLVVIAPTQLREGTILLVEPW